MPTDLPLNMVVPSPSNVMGGVEQYTLNLTEDAKYVLQIGGISQALVGVYGPFPPGTDPIPLGKYGRLRVCGKGSWGVSTLGPGSYLVQATQMTLGQYTLKVRKWTFTDYGSVYLHKSTC